MQKSKLRSALIKDLRRVDDEEGKSSRSAYRKSGLYSESQIAEIFGTYTEFRRAAGLHTGRIEAKIQNGRALAESCHRTADYAQKEVLRFVGKYDRKLRDKRGEKIAVVISDTHSQFLDPFAWRVAQDVVREAQPDLIVLNGDIVDFPLLSRHRNLPGSASSLNVQSEISFVRNNVFKKLRSLAPDATITWHLGNHEIRLIHYIADRATALASLECLHFSNLFGIEEFEIDLVFGGNFFHPRAADTKDAIRKTYRVYWDSFVASHGVSIAKDAARQELVRFGLSGTSGHTHRPQSVYVPTLACLSANWTSTGMMCSEAVGQHYVASGVSGWTKAFGVAHVNPSKRIVHQDLVVVDQGWSSWAGRSWTETKTERKLVEAMYD